MVKVPPLGQMSSVPAIDGAGVGWAQTLVDGLAQIRVSQLVYGNSTVTWPGGQAASTALQVPHNLQIQAKFFLVTGSFNGGLTAFPAFTAVPGATPQQTQVQAFTTDGQLPLAGSTAQFYWLAGY